MSKAKWFAVRKPSTGEIIAKSANQIGEAVFSPNPMWYRPNWSCDFRCNLHGLQYSEVGRVSCLRKSRGGHRLDSCSMELAR